MKKKTRMKNELNNTYGDFIVLAYTHEREPSNGCVKWLCECKRCGSKQVLNGNHLRFGQSVHCQACNSHKRW